MKKSTLLLLPAALLTAIALFYAWTDWWGARQFHAALRMLEEKKESTRLEDFIPVHVPDERNIAAAPIFREIFERSAALEKTKGNPCIPRPPEPRLEKLKAPWINQFNPQVPGNLLLIAREIDRSFHGDEDAAWALILKSLEPLAPDLKEVSTALKRPDVEWPLDYANAAIMPLPYISPLLRLEHILQVRANAELALGSPEKAFQDTCSMLALAKTLKTPTFLIGNLVEMSCLGLTTQFINEALDRHSWNDTELAFLTQQLGSILLLDQYADGLRWERLTAIQFGNLPDKSYFLDTALWRSWKTNAEERHEGGVNELLVKIFYSSPESYLTAIRFRPMGWVNEGQASSALTIQKMIDTLNQRDFLKSTDFWNEALHSRQKAYSTLEYYRHPFHDLPITIGCAIKKVCCAQTILNSTRAACAVERYRLANHHLPATLQELVPIFISSVPMDPMTGDPLHYNPSTVGSFVIYGLGWKKKDEGGPTVSSMNGKAWIDQANWGIVVKPQFAPSISH